MDIDRARTEAMAQYADAHDALNVMVRVASAGLHALQDQVGGVDGAEKLGELVDAVGIHAWNTKRFRAPTKRVGEARLSLAGLATASAVGAFDWYTVRLVEELGRFSPLGNAGGLCAHSHAALGDARQRADARCCRGFAEVYGLRFTLDGRIEDLCDRLLATGRPPLLPLFHFFRFLRNCLVHSGGRADLALADQAADPSTQQAFEDLNTTTSGETPALPRISVGEVVQLQAEHAILASAVCFRIAEGLDRVAVPLMGSEGLTRMAAHYAVLTTFREARSTAPHARSALNAVNWFLESRLRVRLRNGTETAHALRDLELRSDVERAWNADPALGGRRRPRKAKKPR
jgi:hypothetical protein